MTRQSTDSNKIGSLPRKSQLSLEKISKNQRSPPHQSYCCKSCKPMKTEFQNKQGNEYQHLKTKNENKYKNPFFISVELGLQAKTQQNRDQIKTPNIFLLDFELLTSRQISQVVFPFSSHHLCMHSL